MSSRSVPTWARDVLLLSLALKLLLVPAYHSTDFEVHRHWLALTRSLPLSHWYFDETSPWTLDYPPFFAFFSRLLAAPAALADSRITALHAGLEYASATARLVMRSSVLLTELVLAVALLALASPPQGRLLSAERAQAARLVAAAVLLHPGLVIVDHMHFQYNGFLTGVLFWSIWAAREQRPLLCAFLFSSLLMLKHIYIYLAPAYFVFLLRTYVLPTSISPGGPGPMARLFTLGTITLLPPIVGFAPLLLSGLSPSAPAGPIGIMQQILSRLFPFARGLNHAYWAANFWALYTFADRVLLRLASLRPELFASFIDAHAARHGLSSASRGLIGDTSFGVLPAITAGHCFLLTALPLLAFSLRLWTRPTYASFVLAITLSGLTSFIFGYHVHEKAILLPLLPLTLLAPLSHAHARLTLLLSVAGIVGLFPLLFSPRESVVKMAYALVWALCVFVPLNRNVFRPVPTNLGVLAHFAEHAYLCGFVALLAYTSLLHPVLFPAHSVPQQAVVPPSALSDVVAKASSLVAPAASLVAAAVTPAVSAIGSQTIIPGVQADSILPSSLAESASSLAASASATASSVLPEAVAEPTAAPNISESAGDVLSSISSAASEASEGAQAASSEGLAGILQSASSLASEASEGAAAALSQLTEGAAAVFSQTSEEAPASTLSAVAAAVTEAAAEAVPTPPAPTSTPPQAAPPVKEASLEFLPLMLTSVYCALGVMWVWARLSLVFWTGEGEEAGEGTPAKPAAPRAAATTVANGR